MKDGMVLLDGEGSGGLDDQEGGGSEVSSSSREMDKGTIFSFFTPLLSLRRRSMKASAPKAKTNRAHPEATPAMRPVEIPDR